MGYCEKENGIMCIVLHKGGLIGGRFSLSPPIIDLSIVGSRTSWSVRFQAFVSFAKSTN